MALGIQDVAHSFGDRVALDRVSFDVAPGVITGLLGPNGAGKTTLLRIMLAGVTPDRGEVHFDGRRVGVQDRRRWGYMPQERGLYPGMPAGDQIVYFGRLHGLSRQDATARAHALLEELGLGDRWSQRTDKLSGGMQQRVQLALQDRDRAAAADLHCRSRGAPGPRRRRHDLHPCHHRQGTSRHGGGAGRGREVG